MATRQRRPARGRRYRIGEAAAQVGVSPSALRLWERQGLVQPMRSDGGGYRLYSEHDIARLQRVRQMRHEAQVNAPGIRWILRRPAAEPTASNGVSRLRALRHQHRLSLRQASERTGLSVSFISALERGTTGASVATLQRLTHAYGVTVLELFGPSGGQRRLVPRSERRALDLDDGRVRIEQLADGASELEPQLFRLAPGASSDGAYSHGGEEFLYLLEGELTVVIGEREAYRLEPGDSLSFPSTLPHHWRNEASGETSLLWINTPQTF